MLGSFHIAYLANDIEDLVLLIYRKKRGEPDWAPREVSDHVTANNFLRGCSALKIKHGRRNCGFMVFLLREVEKLRYIRIITKAR